MENYDRHGSQTRSSIPKSSSNSQMIPVVHASRENSLRRMQPREGVANLADGANEMLHTENITTEDGSHLQVTRSMRALSNDPYGRHVRETRERIGRDMQGKSDFQDMSFTKADGTKVKRTQMHSSMRFTSGNRPALVQPSLLAADPTVFFNDGQTERTNLTIADQEAEKAYARAQEYLKYTDGVPYPKGFLPSPTFWHRPMLHTYSKNGVSVAFNEKEHSHDDSQSRHSRSSFRSSSHTHQQAGESAQNRPSSLNSHISSTTPDKETRLRSLSAYQNVSNRTQMNSKYSHLQSSSFIHSSGNLLGPSTKYRKASFSGVENMNAINEAKVPLVTESMPPNFTYQIENVSVEKGGTAYFRGTVNGSYPFDTIWYLNNVELRSTNPNIETSVRRDYTETYLTGLIDYIISLKVHNCSQRDAGKYTAYIRNEHGSASSSAFLVVGEYDGSQSLESKSATQSSFIQQKSSLQSSSFINSMQQTNDALKPKILRTMPDRQVGLDGRAVFSCDYASEDAKTQINWYHNSILITKSENQQKYVIRNDNNRSILFILNVNQEDSGNYEIRIINKHGVVSQSANLHVGSESDVPSDDCGFNISINRCRHNMEHRNNSQEYNELIKFINVNEGAGSRRSESLNRNSERRASVTKVIMVKDRRGSTSSCNCEQQTDSTKRYSITKVLPVKSKNYSIEDVSIGASSDYHVRSRSSEERVFHKKTSEIRTHVNRDLSLDSSRKYSVTKVFPVRSTDQLTVGLDHSSLINIDNQEFKQHVEHYQESQQQMKQRTAKHEISEHTCFHGGVTSNLRDFELIQRKSSVDQVAPMFMNAKFLQLKKIENMTNEDKFIQLKKIETETQEEYLSRMETMLNETTEVEDMTEESHQFMQKVETTRREEVDYAQNDYSDIQKEIDEVKQAIDTIDKYEETISKHEQTEQTDMSAEEIYQQRREDRKMKKHVSFDLIPDVVHEYGESAETTEVEEMTDEDNTELTRAVEENTKEEYFEITESETNYEVRNKNVKPTTLPASTPNIPTTKKPTNLLPQTQPTATKQANTTSSATTTTKSTTIVNKQRNTSAERLAASKCLSPTPVDETQDASFNNSDMEDRLKEGRVSPENVKKGELNVQKTPTLVDHTQSKTAVHEIKNIILANDLPVEQISLQPTEQSVPSDLERKLQLTKTPTLVGAMTNQTPVHMIRDIADVNKLPEEYLNLTEEQVAALTGGSYNITKIPTHISATQGQTPFHQSPGN